MQGLGGRCECALAVGDAYVGHPRPFAPPPERNGIANPAPAASLQVPLLLNIASEFNTWVAGFPPAPHATFAILHKLDHCFASLLVGEDIETHEALPGFEKGLRAGMSSTDMVRCRSLAQQARLVMVEVMKGLMGVEEEDGEGDGVVLGDDEVDEDGEESGADGVAGSAKGDVDEDASDEICMEVGSVYEQTLVRLGDRLGDTLG